MAALFAGGFALAGWFVGTRPLGDNSFFWHLRTGHLILDAGIPRHDPYSFTAAGEPWVAQSWLAEVAYALVDDLAGGFGLRVLVGMIAAALALAVFGLALRLAADRLRAAGITVVALLAVYAIYSERPLGPALLLLAVLVWCVEVPDSPAGRWPTLLIPAVIWLWANVHGSWALGGAYLVAHLAGSWLEGRRPWEGRERALAIGGAAGLGLTLVNPYVLDLTVFPVRLLARGGRLADVVEWSSPDFQHPVGIAFGAWLALAVVALARARPVGARDLLVGVGFLLLGLWALRNIAVAVIVTVPIVARALGGRRRSEERPPVNVAVAAGLVLAAVAVTVQAHRGPHYELDGYSAVALARAEADGMLGANLLTTDRDAGYVIWRYWPEQRVFMDDRYDMFPSAVFDDYVTVARVGEGWRDVLDRHEIDVVVWPTDRPLSEALRVDPAWELHSADDDALVLVRALPR